MCQLTTGRTQVHWLPGALWVQTPGGALLCGAPSGTAAHLGPQRLRHLNTVALSSGALRDVAGLLELLGACAQHRRSDKPLELLYPLGDERIPALVEAWERGWTGQIGLSQDALHPGIEVDAGPWLRITAASIARGDVNWRDGSVHPIVALAWRVQTADLTLCFARGAAPGHDLTRLCQGVDLAVIEVGLEPWPRSDRRWRLRADEVQALTRDVPTTWVVTDGGEFGVGAEN